ncbi:ferritin [Bowdeniella nasicola]|uniref:Ferritin n=1 Tax=Bowdeniella nasicola TaxID=208480 RepID=A0A1Q5Q2V0_9ACTO|nr:ferritin [Bowdeniella nasicola]OKL54147.1 ferritin [Bowdeniella nasicola]
MDIPKKLLAAYDEQITLELTAETVYRQLAIELDSLDLPGMATWMRIQAEEEVVHANRFISHVLDRGGHPRIGVIDPGDVTVETSVDAFNAALKHEQKVSESIRSLYRLAREEDDLDSFPLLHNFINEQIEEESSVSEIIGRITKIGDDGPGILRLDAELGARATVDPETTSGL